MNNLFIKMFFVASHLKVHIRNRYVHENIEVNCNASEESGLNLSERMDAMFPGSDNLHSVQDEYESYQNFPLLFNPNIKIRYILPVESMVEISIYNLLGERLFLLDDEIKRAGCHEEVFGSTYFLPGRYICSVYAESLEDNRKFMWVKRYSHKIPKSMYIN
jgi:hypothetical protein